MTDNKIPLFSEELAKAQNNTEQANQDASATPLPSDVETPAETAPYNFTQTPSVASVEASDGNESDIVVPMRPQGEEPGDVSSPIVETTQPMQPNDVKQKATAQKAKPVKYPIAYTDDDLKKAYGLLTEDERQGINLDTDEGKASMSAMVDRLKLPNRLVVGADGKTQRVYLPYDPEDTSSEAYTQSQKPIEVIGTEGKRGGTKMGIPLAEIMDNPSSVRWQFGDTTITGMQPITGGVTQAKVKDLESASYTTDGKPILTFKTQDGQTQKVILNATKADVDKARSERNAVAEVDLRAKEALLQSRQKDIDAKLSKAMQDEGYTKPDVMQGVDDGNSLSSLVRLYLLPRINPKTAPLANAYDTNKATLDKIQAIKTNIANGNTSSGMVDDVLKSGSEVLGGFLSKVSKASTWDNGVSELSLATYGKKAYDKYMAGGKLTDDEQAMLDAIGYSLYFDEAYKDNLHNANLGAGVAESLPYAINIAIAGWTGAGKAVGNAVETSITKALKSRLLKRYGEQAIARWLPSIASKATSALTEAGVATGVGGLKQEADALQRMTGDVDTSTIDATGHASYDKDSNVDGGGVAHYKAFGAGLIENLSEMAEPYIAMIPRGVKSVVSNKMATLAKKSGTFNTLYDAMASLKPSQLSQVLDAGLRKGKINGLFEEVAGEVAGNIANAALIGDMSFTLDKESPEWQNSVFNPEVNADIVAQSAIMSYGFRVPGAIADATYNASKAASSARTNIMGKKAFGDKWMDVKATIDAMSPEDAVEFASNAVKEQSDGCEAVYRYAIQSKGEQLANNIQANKDDNTNDITDVAHETAIKAVDAPITEARQAVKVAQESSKDMPNSLKVSIDALVDNDASDGEVKSLFDQLSDAERPLAEQYYLAQVQLKGHEVGAISRADAETEQFADAVADMSTEVDGNAVVMTADVDGEQKVIKSKGDTMTILADGSAVTSDKVTDVKTSPVEDIVESHREQALQSEMDKLEFAKSHNPNTINPNSGDVVMGADGNQYVYNEATTTNSDGSQVTQTCLYPAIPSEDGGIIADTKQPLLQGITKDEVLAMQDRYYDGLDNNATEGITRNEEANDETDTTESVDNNTTDADTNTNDATPNDGQQTEESVETPNEEQSIDQGVAQTEVSTEQDNNTDNAQPKDVNVTDASKIADTYVSKISKARSSKSDSVRRNADKLVSAFTKKAKASSTTDLGAMVSRLGSQTDNDTAMELLDIANKELQMRKSARKGNANVATESDNDVQETIAEAESETDTDPTEAQKKAGNYKKGHFKIDGYDVSIENPKGSVRRGTDANGKKWEQKMNNTYGYIRGTEGVDGDHIDVFFSDDPSQGDVFVVDQVNNDGTFDEHKVMYGFASAEEARKAYLSNYEDGWQGLGAITHVSKEEFKKWVESSHRKTKPFAEYKNVNAVDGNTDDTTKATEATESPINEEANSHLEESEQKAKERMKYLTPSQVARLMRIGKVAKSMGLGIRFVDTMADNGLYDPNTNTITIALDAENPIEVVFGHEVTHGLRNQSEEAYQSLRNAVMATIPSDAFKARVASTKSLYESAGQKGNDEYYEEEAVCDLVGELVGKSDILSNLKRNADYKVLGWMHSVAKSIMGVLRRGDNEYQKFSEAEKAFRQAYLDAVNREAGNATDTNVEQRKSVRKDVAKEMEDIIAKAKADGTYMKAPNGKPSNLSPTQWAMVRTKAFKEWFGDWESAVKLVDENIRFKDIIGKTIIGYRYGKAPVGGRSFNTLTNSYESGVSMASVGYNTEVGSFAKTANEEEGKYYYIGTIAEETGGDDEICLNNVRKLTKKEYESLLPQYTAISNAVANAYYNRSANLALKGYDIDLERARVKRDAAVREIDCSKVVDENGEPRVVYHGTPMGRFSVFGEQDGNSDAYTRNGMYFFTASPVVADGYSTKSHYKDDGTNDKDGHRDMAIDASDIEIRERRDRYSKNPDKVIGYEAYYNGEYIPDSDAKSREDAMKKAMNSVARNYYTSDSRVFEAFMNLRNPYIVDAENGNWRNVQYPSKEELTNRGHDGVVIENVDDSAIAVRREISTDYIALEPTQIKSATENEGTFDINNKDIRKSLRKDIASETIEEETDNDTHTRKSIRQSAEEAVSAYKEEAERPKPLVSAILHSIRGGKRNVPIDPFVEGWDSIISRDAFKLEETSFDSLKAVEEFQRYMTGSKDVPDYLNAHRALMVLSSVNKAQMDMFEGTYVENLRKAIEEMVGTAEMNKGFYAEDGALAELDRFLKAQHGLERNRDMRVRAKLSGIYNEKIAEAQVAYNQTQDKEAYNDAVKQAQEEYNVALEEFYAKRDEIVAEGLEAGDNWYLINTKLDDYVIKTFFKSDKVNARDLTLAEINALKAKRDELLERAKNEQWSARRLQEALNKMLSEESFKSITGNKKMVSLPATEEYYDELAGLTGMFSWGNTPLGVYLANEEAKQFVSWYKGTENKESLDAVEKAIADINDFSLKKQKESGLVDEDYVNEQKRRYLNFVPLRDFMDVSSDDMYDYLTGQSGVGGNPVKTAKGRHSEAGPAVAGLINVANRSITAGNRNLALQKMYNIVKAKGVNTLANARNRWIVRDSEDTNKWHDAEPEFAPDATAEQVTAQLEEFEKDMKALEEQGLARRVDGKRSPSEYRIMSRTQMDEHKIKVAIGGRQYIIDFLGNPRAAQAANGMTNPDVSDDAGRTLFRTFKNFLASAFTSKNIAFSVVNFFRDTEHSNNYVFIKEGGEYYRRFTERQFNKFKYRSYMKEIYSKLKMFREGKLSEDDTFYQFMNGGGATGYTFVQSQEEEAEKFVKELVEAKKGNWGKKMWNRFFDMVEYMGNVSELTNRYIAFLTSREMGRSIGRSIEDAKEVTLNFNRKGSGTKTKIDGLLPKYLPSVVEYGQRYILFFNANVQAKRQLLYMMKENPAKTTGARIGRAAFYRMMIPAIFAGVFLPAINDIVLPAIYSALGFDDDDDEGKYDYFNKLGDYERTHSINFALPNNAFLSIPVSPDIAPFMTIGDVISAQMQNKRDMSLKDFIEAGTDIISPININYGSEDDINWTASAMSFFPSQMRPIGDVFVNTNFMGQTVYKGGGIGNRQYTPEYKKGMRRTSPALTAWSKFVNDMSGGDEVEKGAMDGLFNNPAVMEHLLKGYLGGYGTATLDMVINPLYNSLTGDFKDLSLKAEQLPLVGRFYKGGSRDEQMRRMERTFRNEVYERNAETRAQELELKKEAMKANREGQLYRLAELRNKYIQLVQSDKYKKYYATKQASEAISDQLKLTSTMTDNEKRYLIDMMKRTIGIYRGEIKIYGTPSEDNQ